MHAEGRKMTAVGERGRRVAIESRTDGTLRARWYQGTRKVRVLLPGLRLVEGAVSSNQRTLLRAEEIALRMSHALARGEDPQRVIEPAVHGPRILPSSLGAVAEEYLSPNDGVMVGEDSLVNYRKFLRDCERILGPTLDLNEISTGTVKRPANELAAEFVERHASQRAQAEEDERRFAAWKVSKKRKNAKQPHVTRRPPDQIPGLTATLKCVQWLFGLARWGFDHKLVDRLAALPKGWKSLIKRIWKNHTDQEPRVDRPGYSEAEVRRLFAVLESIDPRIALMLRVALGARMGQARRVTRNMVTMSSDAQERPTLTIPGGGDRKPGMTIDLSPRAVKALNNAFMTYLEPFERAYRARLIADYWLFPGGFVGYLQSDDAIENVECITEQYLGELFDEAETLAGIEKKPKRRMHGLRRFVRTRGARLESDTRVLDRLIGHDSRGTGGLYEDEEDPWVRRRTFEIREMIIRIVSQPAQEEE